MAFEGEPDGFDMVHTANGYSGWICEAIFETLLTYDYMARPAKLVPGTAEAMPEVNMAVFAMPRNYDDYYSFMLSCKH